MFKKLCSKTPKLTCTFGIIVLFSIIINGFNIYANYYAVSENGSDILLWYSGLLLVCCMLLVILFSILSIIGLFFRRTRKVSFLIIMCCAVFIMFLWFSPKTSDKIRMDAFKKLAERSEFLVDAIKKYEDKYGHPPEVLEKLVPEFIDKVPKTGMATYPDYEYETGPEASSIYKGNQWALIVFTPLLGINFDQFMYFPKQNYPEKGYGGELERVGDWAYVWE